MVSLIQVKKALSHCSMFVGRNYNTKVIKMTRSRRGKDFADVLECVFLGSTKELYKSYEIK